ncbi:uncharacterized protein LOC129778930 [Toxorhynchites rutilus septentrionalis]|uniref:uncharacterized protein LOC129778930 n=1 Tax=Toxorhynchites rutilus septentrionalis TaxID=329112 RepID=UPI0024785604|nr:uncharacterized protein LOC129778930 [Toxorhynchites rutilus septentrionalis]
MRWFDVDDIYGSVGPIYLAMRIFLVRFETIDTETGSIYWTLYDQARFMGALIVDSILTQHGIRSSVGFLDVTNSVLVNAGWYGAIVMNFVFTMSVPTWCNINARRISELYEHMAEFDRELKVLGIETDHQRQYFISAIILTLSLSIGIALLALTSFAYFDGNFLHVISLFPNYWTIVPFVRSSIVIGFFVCNSISTLVFLKRRFGSLNQAIV